MSTWPPTCSSSRMSGSVAFLQVSRHIHSHSAHKVADRFHKAVEKLSRVAPKEDEEDLLVGVEHSGTGWTAASRTAPSSLHVDIFFRIVGGFCRPRIRIAESPQGSTPCTADQRSARMLPTRCTFAICCGKHVVTQQCGNSAQNGEAI